MEVQKNAKALLCVLEIAPWQMHLYLLFYFVSHTEEVAHKLV